MEMIWLECLGQNEGRMEGERDYVQFGLGL